MRPKTLAKVINFEEIDAKLGALEPL
jgi:hypothetical protein